MPSPFFWLHIKKSAGITTRALLKPHYVEVERSKRPQCFIQSKPEEYNDIINNYRVVLGDYQFKRCLFAKRFLFPNDWHRMHSFAFAREPVDRCISMFYYLFWQDVSRVQRALQLAKISLSNRKLVTNTSYAFDVFLEYVSKARSSDSIYHPISNHFTTHTASMWDDVSDDKGKLLLSNVYRLDNLHGGINHVFECCGIDRVLAKQTTRLNKNTGRQSFAPRRHQIKIIESLYAHDFSLYESAH